MISMEFEEMKKVWDTQNQKPMYVIDEDALQGRIQSKKQYASHFANITEILLIIVNISSGAFVLGVELSSSYRNDYMYLLSFIMFVTAGFVLVWRLRRRKNEKRFDETMLGNLDHAIQNAGFQVRLSRIMRWYLLPIGLLVLLGLFQGEKQLWIIILFGIFIALTIWGSKWEHQMYVARKKQLEKLRDTLTSETTVNL